jgi:hypothetical protein
MPAFGGSSQSDEKIHLAPNVFAIADSSAVRFGRWTGYETIDKGAQRDEVADWSPRDRYHCETARHQIEHPIRDLVSSSMRLPDKELVNTPRRCLIWVETSPLLHQTAPPNSLVFLGSAERGRFFVPA